MLTEAVSAEKCKMIKESLFDFVTSQVPDADLEAVDDVIVSYVLATIDAVDCAPADFFVHVNDLIEIINAYVKDFNKINRNAVYVWLMKVVGTFTEQKEKPYMDEAAKPDDSPVFKKDALSFQFPKESKGYLPKSCGKASSNASKSSSNSSSRSNSTSEDDFKFPMSSVQKIPVRQAFFDSMEASRKKSPFSTSPDSEMYAPHIQFVGEMFPDTSHLEVKHCITIAHGDIERAMATLIHRREQGQALAAGALPARAARPRAVPQAEVRSRIIERYSYVDRESETKEHKPLAPKHAPKKMVRYRDNKIVSLKGERYTEVNKGDEEGVKKSNKKHHP